MIEKQDLELIKKIVREEFWELLDTEFLPVLKDYVGVKLDAVHPSKPQAPEGKAPPETVFSWLTWITQQGEKLGTFEVAMKNQHQTKEWEYAFHILSSLEANIENSLHPEGYGHRYWIFPEKFQDRIFRKKLDKKEA